MGKVGGEGRWSREASRGWPWTSLRGGNPRADLSTVLRRPELGWKGQG